MNEGTRKSFSERFSFAAALTDAFVTSRLTAAFILACAAIGAMALLSTPRQDNPRIVVPAANIRVSMPGATPEEMEKLVVRPLEGVVRQVAGVDEVYASTQNSAAVVYVVFEAGEDEDDVLVRLYDRVGVRRELLPPEASAPVIRAAKVDDVPIVTLTLASARYDDAALRRVADRLAEELRTVEGATGVEVQGGRERELRIELDPDRMQAFGVTLDAVRAMVAAGNVAAPVGALVESGVRKDMYVDGFIGNVEDVRRTVVGSHAGRPVLLGDVAAVTDGANPEPTRLTRLAFGAADPRHGTTADSELPAVTVTVAKSAQANAVDVARVVRERAARWQASQMPPGIELVVTRDDGAFAAFSTNRLISHLLISIAAVFVVVTFFLGLRQALVVGIGIPLVLALTLGAVWIAGYSLNRVTLFGLILSLGLLVDDAIVVIENLHRHYAAGGAPLERRAATVLATREIGNPTNLATLAVMIVFTSLMIVPGMMGQYFFPIAFTVPVAMACSLFVAYTVVPWAAHRWLSHEAHDVHDPDEATSRAGNNLAARRHALFDWLSLRFRHGVARLIDDASFRRRAVLALLAAILLAMLQPAWQYVRPAGVNAPLAWFGVETGVMPGDNRNSFNVVLSMPEYTPIEETDRAVRAIVTRLREHPEVTNCQSWLGRSGIIDFNGMLRGNAEREGDFYAEVRVNLRDVTVRERQSHAIVRELRPVVQALVAQFPGAVVQLVEDPPGPPVRGNLYAELYGRDPALLREASQRVAALFAKTHNVVEAADTEPADVPRYRYVVDREKAALSGVTAADVAAALSRLVDGETLGRAHVAGELSPVPIRLVIPRLNRIDASLLSRAFVSNAQGVKVPLAALVRLEVDTADRPIQRKNSERVTYVAGEYGDSPPVYAVLEMNGKLDGTMLSDGSRLHTGGLGFREDVPDTTSGVTLLWSGQQRQMIDSYRDMLRSFSISIVLLFLVLVAYYRSFSLPAVAMLAIPLGLVGVLPGHWLMQQQVSATSLVGIIALAGVVVRNSLLIIDFVLEYRRQGYTLRDAVIEAAAIRLRPIMLTALAIMLGSAVMLDDPMFVGLAISLIFGTLASTVLTLLFVPLMLWRVQGWREQRDMKN